MGLPAVSLPTTSTHNLLGPLYPDTMCCPSILQLSHLEDPSDPSAFRSHFQSIINILNYILPLLALYCVPLPFFFVIVSLIHHGQGQSPSGSSSSLPDDTRGSAQCAVWNTELSPTLTPGLHILPSLSKSPAAGAEQALALCRDRTWCLCCGACAVYSEGPARAHSGSLHIVGPP